MSLVKKHFDAVLVHGDPDFVRLEETFPLPAKSASALSIPASSRRCHRRNRRKNSISSFPLAEVPLVQPLSGPHLRHRLCWKRSKAGAS